MQNNNPFLASGITRLPYQQQQQQYSTQVMACDNRTGRVGGGMGKGQRERDLTQHKQRVQ